MESSSRSLLALCWGKKKNPLRFPLYGTGRLRSLPILSRHTITSNELKTFFFFSPLPFRSNFVSASPGVLCLYLSIYLYYRKRGSASYIVREVLLVRERERYREREIDGSDVTIFALKLAMNLHFPLPKSRTIGDELTLSLAKKSHFSILPSHFASLPSRRVHHGIWWRWNSKWVHT